MAVTRAVVLAWLGVDFNDLTEEAQEQLAPHMGDKIFATHPDESGQLPVPDTTLLNITGWESHGEGYALRTAARRPESSELA